MRGNSIIKSANSEVMNMVGQWETLVWKEIHGHLFRQLIPYKTHTTLILHIQTCFVGKWEMIVKANQLVLSIKCHLHCHKLRVYGDKGYFRYQLKVGDCLEVKWFDPGTPALWSWGVRSPGLWQHSGAQLRIRKYLDASVHPSGQADKIPSLSELRFRLDELTAVRS